MRPLDLPYDLLALRPINLKKNCHDGVWIEIKMMKYDEIMMKYEMKRKYETMNVKVEVN